MSDATRLIIEPLESLLQQVKEMSQNPSKALKLAEKRKKIKKKKKGKNQSDLESIRETISKLAYLLVLGFGRAGDSVISKILYSKNMNLQIEASGTNVFGIFGFCDIRNFTDVTEVLGTEVIRFVNTCGDIVHKIIDKYKGGANKNIGDAFLLVWKLESELSDVQEFTEFVLTKSEKKNIWGQYEPLNNYGKERELIKQNKDKYTGNNPEYHDARDQKIKLNIGVDDNEIQMDSQIKKLQRQPTSKETIKKWDIKKVEMMTAKFRNNLKNSTLAELSFISFLKCIEQVTTDPRTLKYSKHVDIRKKLGDNYLVSLGFGLHAGWAVEGALGSKYKIDLSYLSPNVDMSNRLEGLTKKYKKPLLFTNSIFNLMTSSSIMSLCRKIDRVLVNQDKVMEYYTVDFSVDYLQYMEKITRLGAKGRIDGEKFTKCGIRRVGKDYRVSINQNKKRKTLFINGEIDSEQFKSFDKIERTFEEILMDTNLCFLLGIDNEENKLVRHNFLAQFAEAFSYYESGEWEISIEKFNLILKNYTLDGKIDGPSQVLVNYMMENEGNGYEEFINRNYSRISPDE